MTTASSALTAAENGLLVAARRVAPWAACAALALLPLVSFFPASRPLAQLALVAVILVLSAVQPERGWLACAALAPLGVPLGHWTGSTTSLAEPIVLAFLAGWLVQEALRRSTRRPAAPVSTDTVAVIVPAALFGIAVFASWAVRLAVFHLWVAFPVAYVGEVFHFLWHDYFGARIGFTEPVAEGLFVLEGVGLFIGTVMLAGRARRGAEQGVVALAVAGAFTVCVTAARSLLQLSRVGWAATFPLGVFAWRTAIVSSDVNAAGSYFLIPLGAAVGLALSTAGRRRAWWTAAATLALVGLWWTGSRAALVAAPVAASILGLSFGATRGRSGFRSVAAVVAILALVAACYLVLTLRVRSIGPAIVWRVENGATALRMFAAHPAFGAGVGRFYALSHDYASPQWRAAVPFENAHNNFLQLLAELGVIGCGLLLWLMGRVARPAWKAAMTGSHPMLVGTMGGAVAFVITWLTGHPMVQREAALSFWLVMGLTAALAASCPLDSPVPPARRRRWLAPVLAVVLVASIVPRASSEMAQADLNGAGMGLSNWHVDQEGRHFRWMADRAAVFVPTTGRQVAVPLRSARGTATIKLLISDRAVARLVADSAEWREAIVALPAAPSGRFERVEIRATVEPCAPADDCRVLVGPPRTVN